MPPTVCDPALCLGLLRKPVKKGQSGHSLLPSQQSPQLLPSPQPPTLGSSPVPSPRPLPAHSPKPLPVPPFSPSPQAASLLSGAPTLFPCSLHSGAASLGCTLLVWREACICWSGFRCVMEGLRPSWGFGSSPCRGMGAPPTSSIHLLPRRALTWGTLTLGSSACLPYPPAQSGEGASPTWRGRSRIHIC